jgi:hypothetical protein
MAYTLPNPPIWQQNRKYSARLDRTFADVIFGEGVVDPAGGDFLVEQNSVGLDNSVDVAAGVAVVQGDDENFQGKYLIRLEMPQNIAFGPAPTADARIDLLVLRVNDSTAGSSATPTDVSRIEVVQGLVDPSPVAPSLPDTAIALAEVLRTSGDTAITNAMITDLRPTASLNSYTVNSKFEILTTAERDALTPFAGQVIFNSTLNVVQYYDGSIWVIIGPLGLNDLTDVNTSGVADGDLLTYDNSLGDWVVITRQDLADDDVFQSLALTFAIALGD